MPIPQPDGYLALPPASSGAPVLVLHPWWGLNDTIKSVCDRLATEGFIAFAPDLYHGKVATTIADAEAYSGALFQRIETARADVAAALMFLSARGGSRPISVIGFSLGAFFALNASVSQPDLIRSVVVYYGTRPGDDYASAKAEYLGHFAETDEFEPQSEVDSLAESLKRAGRPATFHHYPGTGHWFAEADRTQAYHATAAALAWERTLAFLRRSSAG